MCGADPPMNSSEHIAEIDCRETADRDFLQTIKWKMLSQNQKVKKKLYPASVINFPALKCPASEIIYVGC